MVDYLQLHSNGLIRDKDRGEDFGDWLSINADTPKDLIGTAFLHTRPFAGQVLPRPWA